MDVITVNILEDCSQNFQKRLYLESQKRSNKYFIDNDFERTQSGAAIQQYQTFHQHFPLSKVCITTIDCIVRKFSRFYGPNLMVNLKINSRNEPFKSIYQNLITTS